MPQLRPSAAKYVCVCVCVCVCVFLKSILSDDACSAGDLGLIPGSGRSTGEGNDNPLQYLAYSPSGCKELDTTERLTHSDDNALI